MWLNDRFFSTLVDSPSKPIYNSPYMTGLRKGGDSSKSSKVLGLTPKGWILAIISILITLLLEPVGGELMYALAQKVRPNDGAFFLFLLVLGFIMSAGSISAILYALIDLIEGRKHTH
jgi:hypothetical protein